MNLEQKNKLLAGLAHKDASDPQKKEVEQSHAEHEIVPGAWVTMEADYGDGEVENEEFVFLKHGGKIGKTSVITPDSIVGKAIQGKSAGKIVVYQDLQKIDVLLEIKTVE